MFTPRFFYDVAAAEAPAATTEPVSPVSLAAAMAKSGRLVQPGNEGEIPKVNISEKKEDAKPAPAPAPATANQAQPAEKVKTESPKPAAAQEGDKPQTEATPSVPTWQEVIKQQQPNAVLKELGYGDEMVDFLAENKEIDPKMVGFLKHWKTTGDAGPYLKALSTDYGKMAPEDVMRHQLQMQNPELDAKQLETLYRVKVTQRYKLDPALYSEEEVDEGRIELMADVKSIRQSLTAEQQNYLFPKPPEAKPSGPDPETVARQQEGEKIRQYIEADPYTKALLASGKLTIGEGDDKFEYPVDTNAISEMMWNGEALNKALKTDQGTPDAVKQWLISGIAKYGLDFFNKYAQHYKTLGGRSAIAPIENAKPPGTGSPAHAEVESTNLAAAMAKRGKLVRGGD